MFENKYIDIENESLRSKLSTYRNIARAIKALAAGNSSKYLDKKTADNMIQQCDIIINSK